MQLVTTTGTAALAQTACPVGTPAGSATCGPGAGGQIASPPPRPSGEWLKTWGAIASNRAGDMGVSSNQLSKREAEQVALDRCAGWNTGDCKIDISYRNQCVAAAGPTGDRRGGGTASDATLERAIARAMEICRKVSGGGCKIKVAECSEPIFRKY
ncbi:DUF4189 domain-containing protein (plasmid) [Rhizobium sp. NIBRBAC000502774]|nr:DUF4189 domain-containing protein [Rhizobium sp. NIBRBAC000502774]